MKGREMEFFIFRLSMIGWYILESTLIGGIMYATGYIQLCLAGYVDNLVFVKTGEMLPVKMPVYEPEQFEE